MATQRSLLPLHACYNTGTNTVLREGDEPRPKRAGVTQPMGLEGLTRRRREKMLGASCFTLRRQVGGAPPESLLRPQRKQPRARPESDLIPHEKWFYLMVITGPPESVRV